MAVPRNALVSGVVAYLARLRFPTLMLVTAALFAVDLIVPDMLPFADEVLLGLLTALFATWRRDRRGDADDASEATPDTTAE